MEAFYALLSLCAENSPVTGEFPAQRPVTRSFDVFFDLRLIKWLSKQLQSWGWWFEAPSGLLWHHCNDETALFENWFTCFCLVGNVSPLSAAYILNCVIIGLDECVSPIRCQAIGLHIHNGLSPVRSQANIKTGDDFTSITPQRTEFNEKYQN